jgi:plastocyanin
MRRRITLLAAAIAAIAVAVPALAATKTVKIGDNYFVKSSGTPTVTVKRGTKVTWVWKGVAPHNVTVTKGPKKFKSKTQSSGSYSATPHTPGTYTIVCTIHLPNMKMKLVVK